MNVSAISALLVRLVCNRRITVFGLSAVLVLLVGIPLLRGQTTSKAQAKDLLTAQPLWFEQTPDGGAMASRFERRSFQVERGGTVRIAARTGKTDTEVAVSLEGADETAAVSGEKPGSGVSNYFLGRDPASWRHGVRHFAGAKVEGVYPGIDVTYYGNGTSLEYDYAVAPQGDPAAIRLRANEQIRLDGPSGDLLVTHQQSGTELLRLRQPVAYQLRQDGSRATVAAKYVRNDDASFGFELGSYDHTRALIIDPVITYSTYFGGSGFDEINDIKTDAAGNIYLLVETNSADLPVTKQISGACNSECGPGNTSFPSTNVYDKDMYIAKLDATGKTLLYSTYIGGSADEVPGSFAFGSDGALYIAGETTSTDFPLVNQYSSTNSPTNDYGSKTYSTTLTKLSADGSQILYSTLIGGGLTLEGQSCCSNGQDSAQPGSVAVGANGIAYLLGFAETATEGGGFGNFIDQKGGTFMAGDGSYIAKFDTTKSGADSLIFAVPYGQPGDREGIQINSIALDSKGNVWAVGTTNFYASITPTSDALQPICDAGNSCRNILLLEINPAGAIIYATFFGGTENSGGGPGIESPSSIFIDPSDNIYVGGSTESVDFPLKNAAYTTLGSNGNAGFLTKFAPGGKSVLYSTYTQTDPPLVSALPTGVVGLVSTQGAGLPVVNGTASASIGYHNDAYYEIFDTTKTGTASLLAASYLGAPGGFTLAYAATADAQGDLLFGGVTISTALPTVNPYQSTCNANCSVYGTNAYDGFVTRVQMVASTGSTTLVPTTQVFPNTAVGTTSAVMTSVLNNTTSASFVFTPSFTNATDFKETDDCNGMVAAGASCTFSFTFAPQSAAALTSTFTLTSTTTPVSLSVALSGTGTGLPVLIITPSTYSFGPVAAGTTPPAETLVLKNTGNIADNALSFQLKESDHGQATSSFVLTPNCTSLAVGATCDLTVSFTPQAGGTATGTLTVGGDPGVTPVIATITGTGTGAAAATLSTTSYSFGSVTDGTTTPGATFTLSNKGGTSLTVSSLTIGGTGAAAFAIVPGSSTCGTAFAAGSACTFNVTFSPTAATNYAATLGIVDQAGTQRLALSGTGTVAPKPTLTPATLAFGSVNVGATSPAQMLTLKNTTTSTIAALSSITTPAQFGYATGGSCGNTLAAGASCTIAIIFQPTTAGPASGVFTVGSGATAATASVTGTGAAVVTVTISPSSLEFGTVSLNATSPAQFLTFSNPTTATVPLSSVVIPPQFANGGHGSCGGSLAPGASCFLEIVFQPTSAGPAPGTLTFGPASTALNGTGTSTLQAAFIPSNLDFGAVVVGANSNEMTTILTNPGPDPIAFNIETGGDGIFVKDSDTCDSGLPIFGATIAPGGSCTLQYHFQPPSVGYFSGSFFVRIGGIDTGFKASLTFTGIGVVGTSDIVAPGILDFGTVSLNTTSAGQFITLINPTTATIALSSIAIPPPFANEGHGTCGANLAPGATCTLEFVFKPTSIGSTVGTFTVGTATAILKGTGTTVPLPAFTPANVDFGSVDVGTYSSIVTLTLSNPGVNAVTFERLFASGSFALASSTCGPGVPIEPGSSCTFTVAFLPNATGLVSENLGVAFTDASPANVTLTGTGVTGKPITISPGSLNFGNVIANSTSNMDLTFTNPNPGEFTITSFLFTGPYSAVGGSCGRNSLPANGSCTFTVGFRPTSIGSFPGSVVFHLSDGSSTNVTFSGTGAGALPPMVTPGLLDFGNVPIGTTSTTQFITFMNPGTVAITLTAPSFAIGANAGTFQINGGTCVGPTSVAGGASCTYGVTYAATIPGQGGGLMFLGGSTAQTATQVTLSATSVLSTPPDFTLSTPAGATVTVGHGSFANLILQVTSASATSQFTSPVTFTVSGLPAGVTASFSSSAVTPIPGGATVIMKVAAASSTAQDKPFPPSGGETAFGISAAALMAGLVGFRRRLNARFLIWLCALGLLGGMVGCGTGISSTPTASTSNIVVTASSGSISHTVNIAVTVQ